MEKQYGRNHLLHAFAEMETARWLDGNCKKFPNCLANIERTSGCNKMSCYNCSVDFCWLCGEKVPETDPYSHFRAGSTCAGMLFEGAVVDEDAPWEGEEDEWHGDDEWQIDEDAPDWVLPQWAARDDGPQYVGDWPDLDADEDVPEAGFPG